MNLPLIRDGEPPAMAGIAPGALALSVPGAAAFALSPIVATQKINATSMQNKNVFKAMNARRIAKRRRKGIVR